MICGREGRKETLYGSGKLLLHKIWILHRCKSFQNAPECPKCVMIVLSCKWSLTFHSMSCLLSLRVTVLWHYYVRDSTLESCDRHAQGHVLWVEFKFGAADGHYASHHRQSVRPRAAVLHVPLRHPAAILSPRVRVFRGFKRKDALLRPSIFLCCHSLPQLRAEEWEAMHDSADLLCAVHIWKTKPLISHIPVRVWLQLSTTTT